MKGKTIKVSYSVKVNGRWVQKKNVTARDLAVELWKGGEVAPICNGRPSPHTFFNGHYIAIEKGDDILKNGSLSWIFSSFEIGGYTIYVFDSPVKSWPQYQAIAKALKGELAFILSGLKRKELINNWSILPKVSAQYLIEGDR